MNGLATPPLSVVMPVHNALPYLDDAIRSILTQRYTDFEFVILDDGSTDGSTARLREWARRDGRIRLVEGEGKLGPAGSSNRVVALARAPIVARMDADDISHPDRLQRQLRLLGERADADLVATLMDGIDRRGRRVRARDRSRLLADGLPFMHGSVMFRRATFDRLGGYRAACEFWEDYDLFLRFAQHGRVLVIPDALYSYRFADTSTRLVNRRERVERAVALAARCLAALERGEDYEPLLAAEETRHPSAPGETPRRLPPGVFLALANGPLWAGEAPDILPHLWRRGDLRLDRASARALLWALWASFSPRSLRWLLRARVRWRDWAVRHQFADGEPYLWRPSATAADA